MNIDSIEEANKHLGHIIEYLENDASTPDNTVKLLHRLHNTGVNNYDLRLSEITNLFESNVHIVAHINTSLGTLEHLYVYTDEENAHAKYNSLEELFGDETNSKVVKHSITPQTSSDEVEEAIEQDLENED